MKMNIILLLCTAFISSCADDNSVSEPELENTDDIEVIDEASTNPPDVLESDSNDTDDVKKTNMNPPNVLGMDYVRSMVKADDAYAALKSALEVNPNIGIVAEVDHQANAASVNLILNSTRIIFFGNPNLGTPLMQKNQLAGLDLPQKIVIYENEQKEVYAGFNNVTYLSTRHNLEGVETLPTIQGALTNFSTESCSGTHVEAENSTTELEEGIITKNVNGNCNAAYKRLRTAIENNPALTIIAEVDHQENAANVGLELNPTRIIIFGNPNLGTPLMQSAQTTALDLPQKMLVWTDDDGVGHVSYNDPKYLAKRHGIVDNEDTLTTISGALDNLSNVAVGEE